MMMMIRHAPHPPKNYLVATHLRRHYTISGIGAVSKRMTSLHRLVRRLRMAPSSSSSSSSSARRSYGSTHPRHERIVVAVGGNALQRRGERLTIENMLKASAEFAPTMVALAKEHELVLTHGNGPQVGELALERSAAR